MLPSDLRRAARNHRLHLPTPEEEKTPWRRAPRLKATDNVAELGKRTVDKAADVTNEIASKAEDTARRGFQAAQNTAGAALEVERAVARRSDEGATEVGQVFAELAKEQVRNNVETFQALTRTLDW